MTAEEIQDQYAEKLGYDNFYCLIKDDTRAVDTHTRKVQELYANEKLDEVAQEFERLKPSENLRDVVYLDGVKAVIESRKHKIK